LVLPHIIDERQTKGQPISKDFRYYFINTPYKRDGSIIIKRLWVIGLGDKGYEGCIASFGECAIYEELVHKPDKIRF
ncbi:hypothetical protein QA786_15025, partial [Listeria monocytogenes]